MWDLWWTKVALGLIIYFPCQFSSHRFLHTHHHLSSEAGTIGQIVTEVPSGLSLTHPKEHTKLISAANVGMDYVLDGRGAGYTVS
jgi:hypothetical protein